MEPGLEATAIYDPPNFSWPGGAHAAVVEVDTETGDARLIRYVAVDDCRHRRQPADRRRPGARRHHAGHRARRSTRRRLRRGRQPAQRDARRCTSCPSAAELPSFELDRTESKSPTNPLGVKGVGETGTIAAAPAVINAVVDALAHLGVTDIQMPATPERVWRAIEEARS